MFKRWRKHLDKWGKCGALFIDLSKAFDSLQYDLLLASYWPSSMRMDLVTHQLNLFQLFYKKEGLEMKLIQNTVTGKIY